jgi:hypothetical protein
LHEGDENFLNEVGRIVLALAAAPRPIEKQRRIKTNEVPPRRFIRRGAQTFQKRGLRRVNVGFRKSG